MKLATLNNGTRDGALCIVSRDLRSATIAYDVAPTMQSALDDWDYTAPMLGTLYEEANRGASGSRWFELDWAQLAAPLPRAYQHIGAYAYIAHLERLCADALPGDLRKQVLLLQRKSTELLGPRADISLESDQHDIDFAAEIAILTDDVPVGVKREKAAEHVRLLLLAHSVVERKTLTHDLSRGYGSFHSHIHTAFAGIAITPDEFGAAWDGRKLQLELEIILNDKKLGRLATSEDMQFDFANLITQAARARALPSGTLIGSGPIANRSTEQGVACIAEQRLLEAKGTEGGATTEYLRFGDRLRINAKEGKAQPFGHIEQQLVQEISGRKNAAAKDPQEAVLD